MIVTDINIEQRRLHESDWLLAMRLYPCFVNNFNIRYIKEEMQRMYKLFVCVTEQHYVSNFFTRLWSVCKPLLFDTQRIQ